MMRSLFSGISGLTNHQTRMDVIGNNIANVNTAGFKQSRVIFQDIFSQTVSGGGGNALALGGSGGINPMQIGLGIRTSSIDVLHTRGAFQRTDNPTDMMIDGDGMFVVARPVPILGDDGAPTGEWEYEKFFTRAGNFYIDNEGYLVNSEGLFVMAWSRNPDFVGFDDDDAVGGVVLDGDTLGEFIASIGTDDPDAPQLTRISLRAWDGGPPDWLDDTFLTMHADAQHGVDFLDLVGFHVTPAGLLNVELDNRIVTIGVLGLAMFSNVAGLQRVGNSLYTVGSNSGNPTFTMADQNGAGPVAAGGLEMSNVDLATQFTDMIVTQRGFQANSRIITVSDSMLEELVNLKR